jgi:hypothetical protein
MDISQSRRLRVKILSVCVLFLLICCCNWIRHDPGSQTFSLSALSYQSLFISATRSVSSLENQLSDAYESRASARAKLLWDSENAIVRFQKQLNIASEYPKHPDFIAARKAVAALRLQLKDAKSLAQPTPRQLADAQRTVNLLKSQLHVLQSFSAANIKI